MVLLMSAYVKYVKIVSPRATVRSSGSTSTARQIGSGPCPSQGVLAQRSVHGRSARPLRRRRYRALCGQGPKSVDLCEQLAATCVDECLRGEHIACQRGSH